MLAFELIGSIVLILARVSYLIFSAVILTSAIAYCLYKFIKMYY